MDTYPLTRWNPEFGAKTAKDPEEAQKLFQPEHNWFATPEEADAHRTEAEADRVLHHSRRLAVDDRGLEKTDRVMMSVQHDLRTVEPMREAAKKADEGPEESHTIVVPATPVMNAEGKMVPAHNEGGA